MMNAPKISSPSLLVEITIGVLCHAGQCSEYSCSSCSYNSEEEFSKILQGEEELYAPVREFNVELARRIQKELCVYSTCESSCQMCLYSPRNTIEFMKRVGNDCA